MIVGQLDNVLFTNFVSKLILGIFLQGFILLVNLNFRKLINDLQESIDFSIILKNFPMMDIIRQGWSIFHLDFINKSGRHGRNKHVGRHNKGINKLIFGSRDV